MSIMYSRVLPLALYLDPPHEGLYALKLSVKVEGVDNETVRGINVH